MPNFGTNLEIIVSTFMISKLKRTHFEITIGHPKRYILVLSQKYHLVVSEYTLPLLIRECKPRTTSVILLYSIDACAYLYNF